MRSLERLLRQEEFEKGFEMGQREFLLGQLTERFGVLPAAVTRRVARASLQDLKRWGSRLFNAASFGDVFAPPRPRLTFEQLLRQEGGDIDVLAGK
jgi:hypothetical protein